MHDADQLGTPVPTDLACAFCTTVGQPSRLFETRSLYALPDKYPLVPGHTLLITQEHLRCLAQASHEVLEELDATSDRVSRFLEAEYGTAVACTEHGVVGQTVFHAHLHLLPLGLTSLPKAVVHHPDVTPVAGWEEVRAYFGRRGEYYYLAVGEQRYVITSSLSPVMLQLRELVSTSAGLYVGPKGLVKTATSADVGGLVDRWRRWEQARQA